MRRSTILGSVLVLAGCDPGVYAELRVTPNGVPANASPGTYSVAPEAAIEQVALRFGLVPARMKFADGARDWVGAVGADGHSQMYVRALRGKDEQVTVVVGEMYTNKWSARADSLRRAIADTLRYSGAVAPVKYSTEPPNDR